MREPGAVEGSRAELPQVLCSGISGADTGGIESASNRARYVAYWHYPESSGKQLSADIGESGDTHAATGRIWSTEMKERRSPGFWIARGRRPWSAAAHTPNEIEPADT